MFTYLSGIGYFHDMALITQIHLARFDKSDSLVESLAEADWEANERNAIVASIARITITTISSTKVKPLVLHEMGIKFRELSKAFLLLCINRYI